jgi:hypothetical protein
MRRLRPATSALSPIIVDTTCAAGITVAAATGLAQHLFAKLAVLSKRFTEVNHSDSPHHAFAHCGVFAPAARRSARALVSVPFSGLMLSHPLRVIGMVGRYPAICLIRRSLIAKRKRSNSRPFKLWLLPGAIAYGALASVSQRYSPLCGRLTTCY